MNCKDFDIYSSAYIDNMLSLEDESIFEEHIASCNDCAIKINNLHTIVDAINEIEDVDLPEGFSVSFREKLDREAENNRHISNSSKKSINFKSKKIMNIAASILILLSSFSLINNNLGIKSQDNAITEYGYEENSSAELRIHNNSKSAEEELSISNNSKGAEEEPSISSSSESAEMGISAKSDGRMMMTAESARDKKENIDEYTDEVKMENNPPPAANSEEGEVYTENNVLMEQLPIKKEIFGVKDNRTIFNILGGLGIVAGIWILTRNFLKK